jgi:hypothetical protein
MTSAYRKIQKQFEKLQESDIRVRSLSYSGKGRPKKSDYKIIKFKDLMDFKCYERLKFGVIPHYTNKNNSI